MESQELIKANYDGNPVFCHKNGHKYEILLHNKNKKCALLKRIKEKDFDFAADIFVICEQISIEESDWWKGTYTFDEENANKCYEDLCSKIKEHHHGFRIFKNR